MAFKKADALADIDEAIAFAQNSNIVAQGVSHLHSCIHRYAAPGSSHRRLAEKYLAVTATAIGGTAIESMMGIAQSLRAEVDAGHLRSFESLVTADLFADLLAQADNLVESSYRRAAAVLAGATLEEHLRKVAVTNSIPITDLTGRPIQTSTLNVELKRANVYGKAEHAQVDAWQKIRNDAAHGMPDFETRNTDADIERMISGIRDFIVKHPS